MDIKFGTVAMYCLLLLAAPCLGDEPAAGSKKGVIRLPKDVPGWFSGKTKNLPDIEYDSGASGPSSDSSGGQGGGNAPAGGESGNSGQGGNSSGAGGGHGSGSGGSGSGGSGAGGQGSHGNETMAANITIESLKDLSAWKDLLSFRPPVSVQRSVQAIGNSWTTHRVEDGQGDVNLDYYPIVIDKLPTIAGKQLTAEQLLDLIRKNINQFVDTDYASFAPFKPADARKWNGNDATGTNILIDIKIVDTVVSATDLAMVVASRHTDNEWVFSTVRGGSGWMAINDRDRPGAHPVSGNRAFGFEEGENGSFVFYVMGADRTTRLMDRAGSWIGFYFADKLWRSYQRNVVDFVSRNGGSARIDEDNTVSNRHDWDTVKVDPTIYDTSNQPEWIRLPRNFE